MQQIIHKLFRFYFWYKQFLAIWIREFYSTSRSVQILLSIKESLKYYFLLQFDDKIIFLRFNTKEILLIINSCQD